MNTYPASTPSILVTGATGFLGHYLVGELLAGGAHVAVLVRSPLDASQARLASLLQAVDVGRPQQASRLHLLEGDLLAGWKDDGRHFDAVIHAAACTRFDRNDDGDPFRTNVEGTERLLAWMTGRGIRRLHHVSTAYVCGRTPGIIPEAPLVPCPEFRNDYEQSKWVAETIARCWAHQTGGVLTMLRPSIIVGASTTGRATRFSGFYLSARAAEVVSKMAQRARSAPNIGLRVRGGEEETQNLVPVDWVARFIAQIVFDPALHGTVYHLTHPGPPSNRDICEAIEACFGFCGTRFVEERPAQPTGLERAFAEVGGTVLDYCSGSPRFARQRTADLEQRLGLPCPGWDQASLRRLLEYAREANWGRCKAIPDAPVSRKAVEDEAACAAYFEKFLPDRVGASSIARLQGLTTTVRFVLEDVRNGQWVCQFETGQLTGVRRGINGAREEFAYRLSRSAFWEVVSGRLDPPQLFLSGRADIEGDIEKALKLATVFGAFVQEFPTDAQLLLQGERS